MTAAPVVDVADGRRARRERGRAAVIDAMFDLVTTGVVPSADEVARRAGVSTATVFRYFDGLADLQYQSLRHFDERFGGLFEIDRPGDGTLEDRVRRFVATRVGYLEQAAPFLRLGRARAVEHQPIADAMDRMRARRAAQVTDVLAAELTEATPARAADLVSVVDTITSPEAWDTMREAHGRTPRQIRTSWERTVSAAVSAWQNP